VWFSTLRNVDAMFNVSRDIAAIGRRKDVAASIHNVLEDTMLASGATSAPEHPATAAELQAECLRMCVSTAREQLDITQIFASPPMGAKDCRLVAPFHLCLSATQLHSRSLRLRDAV
jgi:hypothetical protein